MILRLKTFFVSFSLFVFFLTVGVPSLFAHPFANVSPDESLYQRVKKLGDYGLLDLQDKAVLDQGGIVTRLELAFYTEKAKARLLAPQLSQPTPTFTPRPLPTVSLILPEVTLPSAIPTPIPKPLPILNNATRSEIEEILKELKEESAMLKTRLSLDDTRIKEQAKELEALQTAQDEVTSVWKKANKSVGVPNFNTKAKFRLESFNMMGVTAVNVTRAIQDLNVGMWTDLGGKGALSLGMGAVISDSNASSSPASIYQFAPDISFGLDGPLGHWDTHFVVEAYPGTGSFGDFTRGSSGAYKRYENPFDVKHFTEDKNLKTWDDYMTNIGSVPTASVVSYLQSTSDRVFDGVYGNGTNLPLFGGDTHMALFLGRMGTSATQTQRWEEGLKLDRSFSDSFGIGLSTEWVNDQFGGNLVPQLDMKTYQADLSLNLTPFIIKAEAGLSSMLTGVNNGINTNNALEGAAGQVSASYYPFNLYYSAIGDEFANFQSKVIMAGVNFTQYQETGGSDDFGYIGEANSLISDRYGWRANFGWNGRKQDWLKGLPSFLDDIVINLDVSQKTEYRAISAHGNPVDSNLAYGDYNIIEALNTITFYYPDDEGIWGLDLWGGYGVGAGYPARKQYITNLEGARNDGVPTYDDVRYAFQQTSERIPLIMPVLDVNGNPTTFTSGPNIGKNVYINLTHLKSYNYVTLTTKWQLNKTLGLSSPLYSSIFFTDNVVSGMATDPTQSNISNLFEQRVFDVSGLLQVFRNVNLMGDFGLETWRSAYTYPQVDYRTDSIGVGFAYDIPWGGGKFELRYKRLFFNDVYVPANNYQGNQVFSTLMMLF